MIASRIQRIFELEHPYICKGLRVILRDVIRAVLDVYSIEEIGQGKSIGYKTPMTMVFQKLVRQTIPDNELSGLPYEVPSGLKKKR